MREILFRGKLSHNGTWVYGCLVISSQGTPYIIPSDIIEQDGHHLQITSDDAYWVDLSTVGQYIGLKDKNGTKIFEGDICVHNNEYHYPRPLTVEWIEDYMCFSFVDVNDYHKNYFFQKQNMDNIKVIGNIYDNRNLLK